MRKLINWLLGYVEVQAEGAFPERLLNLCAQERVAFWRLCWRDETSFTVRVRLSDWKRLQELAGRAMCTLTPSARRGLPAALLRWRSRWGFVIGAAMAVLAVSVLSRFVLVMEVTGNETVSSAVILSELQRLGVHPGVYGPGLDRKELANQALIDLPELSFMAINLYGTRIQVVVREAEPAPELLDENSPADIVAGADGIILDIHTAAGQAQFEDGDTVAKGEVLISGDVELRKPEGSDYDIGRLVVHAVGEVTARTWRTLAASIPLTAQVKTYTGEQTTRYSARILWWDIDFFGNSGISYDKYDKITENHPAALFGQTLPLSLTATTFRAYELAEQSVDSAAARTMLEETLRSRLDQILEDREGTVLRTDFIAQEEDGLLTVTLLAECQEQIGVTVEREGETGHVYDGAAQDPDT
jgi:similar to stage IV sporulation protein